ncbi:MAG: peptidylprolyl isomerase [Chlorobi bacterium]|nr:peptidylprolyl isomerase [Chlorobiota bacterium]
MRTKKLLRFMMMLMLFTGLTQCKSAKYKHLEDGLYADIQTDRGDILVKLYPDKAPVTVANFVSLAEGTNPFVDPKYKGKRYYDGLTFHRVISKSEGSPKDFVIQGGDPLGTGEGGPGYEFKNEISDLKHTEGTLSMANAGPDTNGSQFFITLTDTPWLDGHYSAFGKVVKGMDVAHQIRKGDHIKKIEIIRKGKEAKKFDAVKVFSDYMKQKQAEKAKQAEEQKAMAEQLARWEKEAQSLPSGLKIYWLKKTQGKKPVKGQTVSIHYDGYFRDGRMFDSSHKYNMPLTFKVGVGKVIPGMDQGVLQLHEGDEAVLFIPSHLAYGQTGAGGGLIPPDTDLIFKIQLLKVGDK